MDKERRFILQHRDKDAPTRKNMWAIFGGGIDEGETPEQAVRREAKEELGVELNGLKFFGYYNQDEGYGMVEKFIFLANLENSVQELKKQQTEGDDLGLFSFEETKILNIHENDVKVLMDLFKNQ
jgi:8-oxo-dGTP pyrophosphatase MutT (NUDIX family)